MQVTEVGEADGKHNLKPRKGLCDIPAKHRISDFCSTTNHKTDVRKFCLKMTQ